MSTENHGDGPDNERDEGHDSHGGRTPVRETSTSSPDGEHHGGHGDGEHEGENHHAMMVREYRRRFWVSLALSVPVILLSPLVQSVLGLETVLAFPGDRYVQLGFATAIFVYGGAPFLRGLRDEVGERQPGMMTLIGLAISVAYVYSAAVALGLPGRLFFWELATLIDVMLLGHWIEMRSVMGASGALKELAKLVPKEAHLLENGEERDVPVSELAAGDRVVVRPGERVPADGVVVEGRTTVNQAALTGESRPVEKGEGDEVIGGSVNGESAVVVEIQKTGEQSYINQVMDLVREAQESRSRTQDLANRAAMYLTFIAIGAGLVTLVAWLVAGEEFRFALERMVTVMVITCPHALGLAVPLVVAVSTAISARNGLLIRDRSAFERARDVDAVVFDKTGTLTEGRFGVTEVVPLGDLAEDEVLRLAASLESRSEHPIARGVVEEAEDRDIDYPTPSGFRAIHGKGAEAEVEGRDVKAVSPSYLEERGLSVDSERLAERSDRGETVVYVLVDGDVAGGVSLADVVRPESREAVERLKEMGVRVVMMTGDSGDVASWVAEDLGLDEYFAEVLPDEKAERVRELQDRGLSVAMTGDGVNDAPALVAADVGIAVGAGTDVAVESADIVLVRSDPRDVTAVVSLARATYSKMRQNLFWATGYNAVAIPLAAGVLYSSGILLSPAAGAVLMSASTVIVAVNARLLREPSGTGS